LLAQPQPEVRRAGVWILDQWGSPDAIRTLERASTEENDPGVRAEIRDALSRSKN
jgi:HEAT repeat protein